MNYPLLSKIKIDNLIVYNKKIEILDNLIIVYNKKQKLK